MATQQILQMFIKWSSLQQSRSKFTPKKFNEIKCPLGFKTIFNTAYMLFLFYTLLSLKGNFKKYILFGYSDSLPSETILQIENLKILKSNLKNKLFGVFAPVLLKAVLNSGPYFGLHKSGLDLSCPKMAQRLNIKCFCFLMLQCFEIMCMLL
jgi:hypothetical protein